MELRVNYLDNPVGSLGWEKGVSSALGRDASSEPLPSIEETLYRPWVWSRTVEEVATERAKAFPEGSPERTEAERLAARHGGVCRAANKMHRRGPTGKMQRCVVMVRADAGDASCPSWLERAAYNRVKKMTPIIQAASQLGYEIVKCSFGPMRKVEAQTLITQLTAERSITGLVGLDCLVVPDVFVFGLVNVHVIAAQTVAGMSLFDFVPAIATWDSLHYEMHKAAISLGPVKWTELLIANASDEWSRSRVTSGIFYGKAAEAIVKKAAEKVEAELVEQLRIEVELTRVKIENALNIAAEAAKAGDVENATLAVQYAKAYAEDMGPRLKDEFPILKLALELAASFDLSGLVASPVLDYVRKMFDERIAALPKPAPREAVEAWQCVEHVVIKGPNDLIRLAAWVKGVD